MNFSSSRWIAVSAVLALAVVFSLGAKRNGTDGSTASECINGSAGEFACSRVDLRSRLDLKSTGRSAESGNDIWGWTDPETGREYALMGLDSKTAFVDVTTPDAPIHVGDLPTATRASTWRDIKVYRDHAFIVSEASQHGMQVFDLTRLRGVDNKMPRVFEHDAWYQQVGSVHNLVINEETGFAYAVGSNTCDAGMHVIDIRNPVEPVFSTCIDRSIFEDADRTVNKHGEDYTHDAQCIVYQGPDAEHVGKELCVCSNADTVNIVDVTDKAAPVQISVKAYDGLGYTHQGWLTEDHRYFILGDELDELNYAHPTKSLIWDLADIENPELVGSFFSRELATDHNMYVKGDLLYQANYKAGLRILDLRRISEGNLSEVAFFDTWPSANDSGFDGAWSVYPYFASGTVVVSNIDGFLYTLRPEEGLLEN